MSKKRRLNLACRICGVDIEIPVCCDKDMKVKEDMLVCGGCCGEKNISACCGKEMVAIKE